MNYYKISKDNISITEKYNDLSEAQAYYDAIGTGYTITFCSVCNESEDDDIYASNLFIEGMLSQDSLSTNNEGKIVASTSDKRLKQNITPISDALNKVISLSGVSYEYTVESKMGDGIRFGLIAQDVKSVIPEIVRNRAKDNDMLSLSYTEIIPWLIESIKELSSADSPLFKKTELILETQTIASEDNNIELNYNGNKESSLDGGIIVIKGVSETEDAKFTINSDGDWITNNNIIPKGIVIPEYTPKSTSDSFGKIGMITRDDKYVYIKGNNGWVRSILETF